jgi:putative peptide zinc metalloprotease protein
MVDNSKKILPQIRNNLDILDTNPAEDGSKQWLLFDPVQNKYFTIGVDAFELIINWESGIEYQYFIKELQINGFYIEIDSLSSFVDFLHNNNLVKLSTKDDVKSLVKKNKDSKKGPFEWLIHNYLFIKIPIFKPDVWLANNYQKIKFLYSDFWTNFVILLGIIGIVTVFQRLDEFSTTFMYLFSKEGMVYYILSLIFVKVIHELGHAFTAKRYGAKIPSMGVAFLVMFPVLYTDTTNAYDIKSKSQRLQIVLAGMKTELYLAMIATFLWVFLPDGALKSIAFIIATTSWITSLLVNISPFLRFDGYYALSDITDTKNLQPRSFAMARWFIRYYIFGVNLPKPEILKKQKENFFIIYAISTWIYRFFLFLGIAVLVYYFAFKVLGIILFLVEIVWFILLPIYKELKVWFEMKKDVSFNRRNTFSIIVLSFILLFFIYPWKSTVSVSSVVVANEYNDIYSQKAGVIENIYIKNQEHVKKGQKLLSLNSEELEYLIKTTKYDIEFLKKELKLVASNNKLLREKLVLEENLLKKQNELDNYKKTKKELVIKAPFDGVVIYNHNIYKNQNIETKEPIFSIYNPDSIKLVGFANIKDLKYIQGSNSGKFIADNGINSIDIKIDKIHNLSINYIEYPEVTSLYSGDIAVRESDSKELISEESYFKIDGKIISKLDSKLSQNRIKGKLIIDSKKHSITHDFYQSIYYTLIKESGF